MAEDNTNNNTASVSLGDILRKSRTEAGLTVADVASELLLKPDLIRSIEANELKGLAAPTYVRGYIRSYAKLLGVDADALVEEYESIENDQPVWEPGSSLKQKTRINFSAFIIPVAVIIAGLFIAWLVNSGYLSTSVEDIENIEKNATSIGGEATNKPLVFSSQQSTVNLEKSTAQPLVMIPAEETPASHEDSANNAAPDKPASGAPLVSTVVAATVQLEEPIDDTPVVTNGDASIEKDDSSSTIIITDNDIISAATGSDEVILILTDDSWVEVEDATREKMVNGLLHAGDIKILRGKSPFQVFLGNAEAVEITINNVLYDVQTHRRKNKTARFALTNP